jgi:outer membrane protein TolC
MLAVNIYQKKKTKMQKFMLALLLFTGSVCLAQNNLSFYIAVAKQNSPLINDNKNQSKANLLDAERLKAFYTKPQIGVTANFLFAPIISTDNNKASFEPNSNGATNYYGYDIGATNGGQYQALIGVSQPLFNGKRYQTAGEQLTVTSQINENNSKLIAHDIEKIVTDQYILCLQDNKQITYAEVMIKLLADQKEILKMLVENSIYKKSDLSLLNIEYNNFLAQLTAFKANYRRDLMDLNILCGISDTATVQLENSGLILNNTVSNSMFLEKYRLDSLSLVVQRNAFELKYKPQLNLFANTGLNAVYAPSIPNRFGISAGLSFTYNLFDGHQKAINQSKTQVLEQSVSFYKNNFITQNSVRKSKILIELQSYTDRISLSEQQLKDYDLLLSSYKKEILSGQLSIINYTMVLKNMAIVQRDYTLLFSQQQSLINAYNYWNW